MNFHRPDKLGRHIRSSLLVGTAVINAVVIAFVVRDIVTRMNKDENLSPQSQVTSVNKSDSPSIKDVSNFPGPDAFAPESHRASSSPDNGLVNSELATYVPPVHEVETTQQQKPVIDPMIMRAAQVTYEANRRLAMLTKAYDLSEDQQALIFPIIARASPSYIPALPIEGKLMTDAYLSDLPLDKLESQVAPNLDDDQQAKIDEEQVDRFYWWKEALTRISGQTSDKSGGASESTPSPASSASSESQPAAHQGGNLLDLLNQP